MRNVAVYSFKNGMETLIRALEDYLEALPNVTIMKNTRILRLEPLKNSIIQIIYSDNLLIASLMYKHISHSSGEPMKTTHAVSALPLPTLHAVPGQKSPASYTAFRVESLIDCSGPEPHFRVSPG